AERENRTLVEMARTMLIASKLPNVLWAEAVATSAYILNRTACSGIQGVTPYELWYGRAPKISHLRIFGTTAYAHIPDQRRSKLDAKSQKGFLVGYCDDDGFRVYVPDRRVIVRSATVTFDERLLIPSRSTEAKPLSPFSFAN